MPNHVTSICTVTGPSETVATFIEKHVVTDTLHPAMNPKQLPVFDVRTVITRPAILDQTSSPARPGCPFAKQAKEETGFDNWYDWSLANWGTKWGTYDFKERERADGKYVFEFQSAWSFPDPVFQKLAKDYPNLVFDVICFDEGGGFGGKGQFNGTDDFRCAREFVTDELFEKVYGVTREVYENE